MDSKDLRRWRERRNLTQQALADDLNRTLDRKYSKTEISLWESGKRPIPPAVGLLIEREAPRMSAKIVAVANQKGGVAKTTVAVNLAAMLAGRGHRVLLVDTDAQSNATMTLDQQPHELSLSGRTIHHVIEGNTTIQDAIISPLEGVSLDLLPASLDLEDLALNMTQKMDWNRIIQRQLRHVAERYDYIIIDTPPNLGVMTANALTAADKVLVPTQAEPYSVYGIHLLFKRIAAFQDEINPRLTVLGILPTLYNKQHEVDRLALRQIEDLYGNDTRIYKPIPRATIWRKAAHAGVPLLLEDTKATGYISFAQVVDDLAVERLAAE